MASAGNSIELKWRKHIIRVLKLRYLSVAPSNVMLVSALNFR